MATRKTASKKAAAELKAEAKSKEPEGSVSALPDGLDRPANADSTGAVSAVPDLPGENTES